MANNYLISTDFANASTGTIFTWDDVDYKFNGGAGTNFAYDTLYWDGATAESNITILSSGVKDEIQQEYSSTADLENVGIMIISAQDYNSGYQNSVITMKTRVDGTETVQAKFINSGSITIYAAKNGNLDNSVTFNAPRFENNEGATVTIGKNAIFQAAANTAATVINQGTFNVNAGASVNAIFSGKDGEINLRATSVNGINILRPDDDEEVDLNTVNMAASGNMTMTNSTIQAGTININKTLKLQGDNNVLDVDGDLVFNAKIYVENVGAEEDGAASIIVANSVSGTKNEVVLRDKATLKDSELVGATVKVDDVYDTGNYAGKKIANITGSGMYSTVEVNSLDKLFDEEKINELNITTDAEKEISIDTELSVDKAILNIFDANVSVTNKNEDAEFSVSANGVANVTDSTVEADKVTVADGGEFNLSGTNTLTIGELDGTITVGKDATLEGSEITAAEDSSATVVFNSVTKSNKITITGDNKIAADVTIKAPGKVTIAGGASLTDVKELTIESNTVVDAGADSELEAETIKIGTCGKYGSGLTVTNGNVTATNVIVEEDETGSNFTVTGGGESTIKINNLSGELVFQAKYNKDLKVKESVIGSTNDDGVVSLKNGPQNGGITFLGENEITADIVNETSTTVAMDGSLEVGTLLNKGTITLEAAGPDEEILPEEEGGESTIVKHPGGILKTADNGIIINGVAAIEDDEDTPEDESAEAILGTITVSGKLTGTIKNAGIVDEEASTITVKNNGLVDAMIQNDAVIIVEAGGNLLGTVTNTATGTVKLTGTIGSSTVPNALTINNSGTLTLNADGSTGTKLQNVTINGGVVTTSNKVAYFDNLTLNDGVNLTASQFVGNGSGVITVDAASYINVTGTKGFKKARFNLISSTVDPDAFVDDSSITLVNAKIDNVSLQIDGTDYTGDTAAFTKDGITYTLMMRDNGIFLAKGQSQGNVYVLQGNTDWNAAADGTEVTYEYIPAGSETPVTLTLIKGFNAFIDFSSALHAVSSRTDATSIHLLSDVVEAAGVTATLGGNVNVVADLPAGSDEGAKFAVVYGDQVTLGQSAPAQFGIAQNVTFTTPAFITYPTAEGNTGLAAVVVNGTLYGGEGYSEVDLSGWKYGLGSQSLTVAGTITASTFWGPGKAGGTTNISGTINSNGDTYFIAGDTTLTGQVNSLGNVAFYARSLAKSLPTDDLNMLIDGTDFYSVEANAEEYQLSGAGIQFVGGDVEAVNTKIAGTFLSVTDEFGRGADYAMKASLTLTATEMTIGGDAFVRYFNSLNSRGNNASTFDANSSVVFILEDESTLTINGNFINVPYWVDGDNNILGMRTDGAPVIELTLNDSTMTVTGKADNIGTIKAENGATISVDGALKNMKERSTAGVILALDAKAVTGDDPMPVSIQFFKGEEAVFEEPIVVGFVNGQLSTYLEFQDQVATAANYLEAGEYTVTLTYGPVEDPTVVTSTQTVAYKDLVGDITVTGADSKVSANSLDNAGKITVEEGGTFKLTQWGDNYGAITVDESTLDGRLNVYEGASIIATDATLKGAFDLVSGVGKLSISGTNTLAFTLYNGTADLDAVTTTDASITGNGAETAGLALTGVNTFNSTNGTALSDLTVTVAEDSSAAFTGKLTGNATLENNGTATFSGSKAQTIGAVTNYGTMNVATEEKDSKDKIIGGLTAASIENGKVGSATATLNISGGLQTVTSSISNYSKAGNSQSLIDITGGTLHASAITNGDTTSKFGAKIALSNGLLDATSITNNSNGIIDVSGGTIQAASMTISAGSFNVTNSALVKISSLTGNLNLNGTLKDKSVVSGGAIVVSSSATGIVNGGLSATAALNINNGGTATFSGSKGQTIGAVTNYGTMNVSTEVKSGTSVTGGLTASSIENGSAGTSGFTATLNISGGLQTVTGTIGNYTKKGSSSKSLINITGGTLHASAITNGNNATGNSAYGAKIMVGGGVLNASASITNNSNGIVDVTGGTIQATSMTTTAGSFNVGLGSGSALVKISSLTGNLNLNGALKDGSVVSGGAIVVSSGATGTVSAGLSATAALNIKNGGTATFSGSKGQTIGAVTNSGTMNVATEVKDNKNKIIGGLTATSIENGKVGSAAATLNISGGLQTVSGTIGNYSKAGNSQSLINITGGTLTAHGLITNGDAENNKFYGAKIMVGGGVLNASASITNNKNGLIEVAGGKMEATNIVNNGTINVGSGTTKGTLITSGTSAGTIVNNATGAITIAGADGSELTATGLITNAGSIDVQKTLNANGGLTVNGGSVTVSGTLNTTSLNVTSGTVTVTGANATLEATGWGDASGKIDVLEGATLNANLNLKGNSVITVDDSTLKGAYDINETSAFIIIKGESTLDFTAHRGNFQLVGAELTGAKVTAGLYAATITVDAADNDATTFDATFNGVNNFGTAFTNAGDLWISAANTYAETESGPSLIVGAFTNTGAITIDVTGLDWSKINGDSLQLISANSIDSNVNFTVVRGESRADDTVAVVKKDGNQGIYLVRNDGPTPTPVSTKTIALNNEWDGFTIGTEVFIGEQKFIYGRNAFSNTDTMTVGSDTEEFLVVNGINYHALTLNNQNLTIVNNFGTASASADFTSLTVNGNAELNAAGLNVDTLTINADSNLTMAWNTQLVAATSFVAPDNSITIDLSKGLETIGSDVDVIKAPDQQDYTRIVTNFDEADIYNSAAASSTILRIKAEKIGKVFSNVSENTSKGYYNQVSHAVDSNKVTLVLIDSVAGSTENVYLKGKQTQVLSSAAGAVSKNTFAGGYDVSQLVGEDTDFFDNYKNVGTKTAKENTNVTIDGGQFSGYVIGGDMVKADNKADVTFYRWGNTNLTINGGDFETASAGGVRAIAGGLMFAITSGGKTGRATIKGDVNLTISGGTFYGYNIYGGNFANNSKAYGTFTNIEGNITVTLDCSAQEGGLEFKSNNAATGLIYAGSYGASAVKGNTTVVLKGDKGIAFEQLVGGSSGDDYSWKKVDIKDATDPDTVIYKREMWVNESMVSGSRTLSFTGFEGDLAFDKIHGFNTVSFEGENEVNFTGEFHRYFNDEVTTWIFAADSVINASENSSLSFDFTDDTVNLTAFTTDDIGWELDNVTMKNTTVLFAEASGLDYTYENNKLSIIAAQLS